jgi:hypothetical protein
MRPVDEPVSGTGPYYGKILYSYHPSIHLVCFHFYVKIQAIPATFSFNSWADLIKRRLYIYIGQEKLNVSEAERPESAVTL